MATKKRSTKQGKKRGYAQLINPIHHLERTIEMLDKENDRLQERVFILSVLSILLAIVSILISFFH